MIAATTFKLVVVTPERTVLDEPVRSLRFPLYDGQIGILPGRAPMVGRLGFGELKVVGEDETASYFVDGGFVQVKGATVTLLTARCIPVEELDIDAAEQQLAEALRERPTTDEAVALRDRALERARRMLALRRR